MSTRSRASIAGLSFVGGTLLAAFVLLGVGSPSSGSVVLRYSDQSGTVSCRTSGHAQAATVTSTKGRMEELQQQLQQAEQRASDLSSQNENLQKQLQDAEKRQQEPVSAQEAVAGAGTQQLQDELAAAKQRVADLEKEMGALQGEKEALQKQVADCGEDEGESGPGEDAASGDDVGAEEDETECEGGKRRAKELEEASGKQRQELAVCEDDLRTGAEADRQQLAALLKAWPQLLEDRRSSISAQPRRGILVSGSNGIHLANAFVNLYVLRHHLNCSLPAAITYWGTGEHIADTAQAFFKEHISDLIFHDSSKAPYPSHQRPLLRKPGISFIEGWKLKVYGIYQAPFQEIIFLDSDCMPLYNPAVLFEAPEYTQHGVIIFPDRPGEPPRDSKHQLYRHFGLHNPWAGERSTWPSQSDTGMLLLNRQKHADVLEYLLFLNVHDEFTYRMAFGDKDTFRAAFDLAGKRDMFYQSPLRMSLALSRNDQGTFAWRGYLQVAPNGSVAFIHRSWFTKYNPSDDTSRAFTHLTVGLSPVRAKTNEYFSSDYTAAEVQGVPPEKCQFDSLDIVGSERRCGFNRNDTALPIPAFTIPETSAMARSLRAADDAFKLLRAALATRENVLG